MHKYFGFGKKGIIFCSLFISLLFISSVTAVPQVYGADVVDRYDELNSIELFNFLSINQDFNTLYTESLSINSLYLFSIIIGIESDMIINPDEDRLDLNFISEKLGNQLIDEKDVISETKNCICSLLDAILMVENNNDFTDEEYDSLNILEDFVSKIDAVFTNNFYNDNDMIKEDNIILENGIFQKIIALIQTVLQFIVTILKALFQGVFTLFKGLIKTIGAIIGIIVLILADVQTILLLTGLYFISIGLLSKNIIMILGGIGAPIFAAISALLSISIGSLLGNLSVAVFSVLGVLIILAIPIALVLGFLYLSGYFEDGDGGSDGLLYIIASCISYYINAIR